MSAPQPRTAQAVAPSVALRAEAAQVEGLYAKLPVAVAANLPVIAAAAWAVRSSSEPTWLLAWVGLMAALVAARLVQWRAYGRRGPSRLVEPKRWARLSTVGSLGSGLAWGLGLALFLPPAPVTERLFVVALLAGLLAGSAGTLSDHLPAFLAFGVPLAVPTLLVLAGSPHPLERLLLPFSLIYLAVITWVAHSSGARLRAALQLRFRNEALVVDLTATQERLTSLNAGLERRVAERGDQLAQVERQLGQAALLASVGSLATSVAHELNSPLASILGNLSFVREELGGQGADLHACQEALADASHASVRVGEIVCSLGTVARTDGGGGSVRLRDVLEACATVAAGELRARAAVVRHLGDVPPVRGDTPGLAQVFLQLILHAARALPEGDPASHTLLLRTTSDPAGAAVVVEVAGLANPGAAARLALAPALPLDPTDLGLQLSVEVVARLGGRVTSRTRPGDGLFFEVRLPAAAAP